MRRVQFLLQQEAVQQAVASLRQNHDDIVALAIAVQQIAAPTFAEGERASFIQQQMSELGLTDVAQDALHNVYGRLPSEGNGTPLVVTAHNDTVFPADTDLSTRQKGDRLYGPGIADNALGVAGLLFLARTICERGLSLPRDVWFVSNSGEEGLGDLRGMRAVVERFGENAIYLVLEGGLFGYVCHEAIGVQRFRITVNGPGGHSWGSFGTPNAIHILARLVAGIESLDVPSDPKTTFNVGTIEGGTAVNVIARTASLLLDLRSESPAKLEELVGRVRALVEQEKNGNGAVSIEMERIGHRPAGRIPRRHYLVREAVAALRAVGCDPIEFTAGSTDANIPLSRGLPAVCIGLTRAGNTHRTDEYLQLSTVSAGLGQALLLLLAASQP